MALASLSVQSCQAIRLLGVWRPCESLIGHSPALVPCALKHQGLWGCGGLANRSLVNASPLVAKSLTTHCWLASLALPCVMCWEILFA